MTALAIFDALTPPERSAQQRVYAAGQLTPVVRVAKGPAGHAALLIAGTAMHPPIRTRYLAADFGVTCIVTSSAHTATEALTVIECLSLDRIVIQHFLTAVSAVVEDDNIDTAAAIRTLIEVFKSMSRQPLTSVQGLWGELFVISRCVDPVQLITAWHVTQYDRHDFTAAQQRIEVKTTTLRQRRHRFTYDQVVVTPPEQLVVASLLLETAASGATIGDLTQTCLARLPGTEPSRQTLLRGVAEALGEHWDAAERQRYDVGVARQSLRFYDSTVVPTLNPPFDQRISDITYTADLTGLPALKREAMAQRGGLMAAAELTGDPQ